MNLGFNGSLSRQIALDVFMTVAARCRWRELSDIWPDDYTPPDVEPFKVDDSWIGARSFENMKDADWLNRDQSFQNWRNRKGAPHYHAETDPELMEPLGVKELNNLNPQCCYYDQTLLTPQA